MIEPPTIDHSPKPPERSPWPNWEREKLRLERQHAIQNQGRSQRLATTDSGWYFAIAWLFGVPAFFSCWIYAILTYGWFLGIGLGWLPSIFIGAIIGLLWPFLVIAAVIFLLVILR